MRLPEHGANSKRLYTSINIPMPDEVLDFSENCNPAGPPPSVVEAWPTLISTLNGYPDPDGQPFRSAVSVFHQVDEQQVLIGNGAADILSLLAGNYRGKRVLLIDPTFSEYRATLEVNGAEVVSLQASEAEGFELPMRQILEALPTADAIYICTPNNPTGLLPTKNELLTIIEAAKNSSTDVVLDEAFIDFVDESKSFIPQVANYSNLFIVRSMTKMYAIPGIRLGYVIAHPERIEKLKQRASHWHVNGLAAEIGVFCLQEEVYRQQAILHAQTERIKMTQFLRSHSCEVLDSSANYLVMKPMQDAKKLYKDLLNQGIVLRHSENFRGMDGRWLRIGMKSETMMDTLREAMDPWFKRQ
ncbi:threonine-phosphate decarboxylase [Sporosarcina sp. P16a]|uniref:threonine-phosphate decarboxylase CobD n=1 Tax=unclassified Sporosarcina TaxID=2647733 RepID=UPI000C16A9A7|nr:MULTISPECIES: threonine-phosphate decarboxylase CobD [unclassified Sporosarcina]PIC66799.1 threonine-phosphate decarboxylase [Sporosarcina sp. P16a]PIC94201.1 threonine-phosphate decarboxylase [Sporosarcina sp. P25]